jgi:hypothetical protein
MNQLGRRSLLEDAKFGFIGEFLVTASPKESYATVKGDESEIPDEPRFDMVPRST